MSTDVIFDPEADEAIKEVRNDASDIKYVICNHIDGDPKHIGLVSTGTDTGELVNRMEPSENFYILARYETVFDMSTTIKFVYFIWNGEKVSFVKKGRYGVMQGSIEEHFNPYHIVLKTSSADDLEDENVKQQLMETSGTKSKVLDDTVDSKGKPHQMRGFTQTQVPQRSAKTSFGVSAVAAKGASVNVTQDVYDAVAKVHSDEEPETWMVAGYENGSSAGPIVCMGSGSSELQELKDHMNESLPMYGLYRVSHTDDQDITTIKFIYIQWVGSKVKPTVKAKVSTHKGTANEIFTPAHVHIFATDLSDIDEKDIMREIEKQAAH